MSDNETIEKSEPDKKRSNNLPAPPQPDSLKQGDQVARDTIAKKQWANTMDGVKPLGGGNYYLDFVPVRIEKKQPNGKVVRQDVRMTHEEYGTFVQQKTNGADSTKLKPIDNAGVAKDVVKLKNTSVKTLVAEHKDQPELCGSVGKGGENEPADLLIVKAKLVEIGALQSQDADDMACMEESIEKFQKTVVGASKPDGRIDPKGYTWPMLQGTSRATYQLAVMNAASAGTVRKSSKESKKTVAAGVSKPEPAKEQGLSKTVLEVIADNVFRAIDGLGTDEKAVYANLAKLNHDAATIGEFKKIYKARHGRELVDDIRGDFSDNWFFGKELTKALSYLKEENTVPPGNGKALSKNIKDWSEKQIAGGSTFEKNQWYAQMLLEAEQKGLVVIQGGAVRDTFNKIIAGDKIGTGKKYGQKADYYSDPQKQMIFILPVIVEVIKGLIKSYGDKATEHKFSLGSFMVWNDAGTSSNGIAHTSGELRTTNHGEKGRAIDINGIGGLHFDKPEAVALVSDVLSHLPKGKYEIGLPMQGDFFPSGLTLYDSNAGGTNQTFRKLKSKDLLALIENLMQGGITMRIFPDRDNHLHLGVES